jgi:Domain of unknown function (DUF397)
VWTVNVPPAFPEALCRELLAAISEMRRTASGVVAVRDSKDPGGPKLAFAPDEWLAFTAGIKAGEFDVT